MSRKELKEFFEDYFNQHLLDIGNFDLLFERYYNFVQNNQGLGYPLEVGELTQLLLDAKVNLFNNLSIYNAKVFNPNYVDLCGASLMINNISVLDFKALAVALVFGILVFKLKKHPVVYIALGAVVGIILQMGNVSL